MLKATSKLLQPHLILGKETKNSYWSTGVSNPQLLKLLSNAKILSIEPLTPSTYCSHMTPSKIGQTRDGKETRRSQSPCAHDILNLQLHHLVSGVPDYHAARSTLSALDRSHMSALQITAVKKRKKKKSPMTCPDCVSNRQPQYSNVNLLSARTRA